MELKDFEGVDPTSDILSSMLNIQDNTKIVLQIVAKTTKRDEFARKLAEKKYRLTGRDITNSELFLARIESYILFFIPLLPILLAKLIPAIINALNPPKIQSSDQVLDDNNPNKVLINPEDFANYKKASDQKMKATFTTYIRAFAVGKSKDEKIEDIIQSMVTLKSDNLNQFIYKPTKNIKNLAYRFLYPESQYFPFFRNIFTSQRTMSSRELSATFHLPEKINNPLIEHFVMPQIPAKKDFVSKSSQSDLFMGINKYRNAESNVFLSEENRKRHLVVTGQTGTGKSTILKNFVLEDIDTKFINAEKRGLMLLDPHEDFFVDILRKTRNITDTENFISWDTKSEKSYFGFNPLYAVGMSEREIDLVVDSNYKLIEKLIKKANPESGMGTTGKAMLMNGMKTLMVLQNDWIAKHNSPANIQKMKRFAPTLIDLKNLFSEAVYPKIIEELTINNYAGLRQFWHEAFKSYKDSQNWTEIKQGFDNKISQILTGVLFYTFGQSRSSVSMSDVIRNSKILLVNLSSKNLGEEGMSLLGALLMSKAWFEAKKIELEDRNPFVVYADEFQNFATPDFSQALSESRKFKLELILAHQYFHQLPEEVLHAVNGNVKSRIFYRAGVEDAELIVNEMQGKVLREEIMEMPEFHAIAKVGEDLISLNIPKERDDINSLNEVNEVISENYERYGMKKSDIVAEINNRFEWLKKGLEPVD